MNLLVATLVLVIISDFLLDLFSMRISLATGRVQSWLFDHFGQNLFADFLIAILFQFVSFRKKAFLLQLGTFINTGSFSGRQLMILMPASMIGVGLSMLLLTGGSVSLGAGLFLASLFLGLNSKEQLKDVSLAFLALSLFIMSFYFFGQYLKVSTLNIHHFQIQEPLVIGMVVGAALFFRTPVALLLILSVINHTMGLNVLWLPLLFFIYCFLTFISFYSNLVRRRSRLYFSLSVLFVSQLLQLLISWGLVYLFMQDLQSHLSSGQFFQSYQTIVIAFVVYCAGTLLIVMPIYFLLSLLPIEKFSENKKDAQKIEVLPGRGQVYSLHMSLFLLRQEFKKYTTSVHTLFKLSRETGAGEEKINQRYARYQSILTRVGDELKELCFSVGRQRSYRWQVREVMTYYKMINQLELLVEDLNHVIRLLNEQHFTESQEKDCRFWLGLQLKIFESFFHFTVGVGRDEKDKVQSHIDKSYEVLDRFFVDSDKGSRSSSQTFYRITESIASLAL